MPTDFTKITPYHEEIECMYMEGSSRSDIARALDLPLHQVRAYMVAQGWFREPILQTKEELEHVMDLTGWTNTRAAAFIGCSESTIRDRRRRFNV